MFYVLLLEALSLKDLTFHPEDAAHFLLRWLIIYCLVDVFSCSYCPIYHNVKHLSTFMLLSTFIVISHYSQIHDDYSLLNSCLGPNMKVEHTYKWPGLGQCRWTGTPCHGQLNELLDLHKRISLCILAPEWAGLWAFSETTWLSYCVTFFFFFFNTFNLHAMHHALTLDS